MTPCPDKTTVDGVDSLAQSGSQGVTLDSLSPIELKILYLMDYRIDQEFCSLLGLRFQDFLKAAVIETSDEAARWTRNEP